MPYSAARIANAFLVLAKQYDKQLTNMQLQKLVYIAHGFHLAFFGQPLFYNEVKAWDWGPVIPKLYMALKRYGAGVVTDLIPIDEPQEIDSRAMSVLKKVWTAYGPYSGPQLSTITHQKDTPWRETYEKDKYGIIPNELIAAHYKKLIDERPRATAR